MYTMKVIFFLISSVVIKCSLGLPIIHETHDKFHTKIVDNGETSLENSPIVTINNYQEAAQQQSVSLSTQGIFDNGHHSHDRDSFSTGHKRGDDGSLPSNELHKHESYVNTNIKAGDLKYRSHHGGLGHGFHNSLRHESYHHREGYKFGQHHDRNMFGNARKVVTTSSPISVASPSPSPSPSASASGSSTTSLISISPSLSSSISHGELSDVSSSLSSPVAEAVSA